MTGHTNNFNDELRARLSIVDIVGRKVPLTKKGQNFWGCCPFHNEKTASFSVSEQKGFYHCFGCGEHGDIISFVMKTQNMQYIDAIKELANMAGMKVPEYKPKTPEQTAREQSYIEIMEGATRIYQNALWSPAGAAAMEYLRRRGFSDDTIKKYRIGFAPNSFNTIAAKFANQKIKNVLETGLVRQNERGAYDFFRDRLMFPIFNPNGAVIAFSGRSMDGSEPKYINTQDTELFHKRRTVFGLNFARDAIYKANRSIVVEGQIDVIQMQIHGFPETVAPLGTALTEEHLQILCKANRNITFCFDGDAAGQKAAARAVGLMMPLLRDNSDVRFAFMPKGLDPDDILRESGVGGLSPRRRPGRESYKSQNLSNSNNNPTLNDSRPGLRRGDKPPTPDSRMKQIIDSAIPLVDFLWQIANKNYLINTPGGRANAEKFLRAEIEKITDPTLKNEFRQEYDQRKFNDWHKWKKSGIGNRESGIEIPKVDVLSQKTLSEIAAAYPELIEKHSDFLVKIGAKFDDVGAGSARPTDLTDNRGGRTPPLQFNDAEKFIVSLKLKNYIQNLTAEKKELTAKLLNGAESKDDGNSARLSHIDSEIKKSMENLSKISAY